MARASADDSRPRRRVRRPTAHAYASLHPHRPQPRYWLAPSTGATRDGRPRDDGARAISLGSCDYVRLHRALTCANDSGMASLGSAVVTVVPRCSPLDLVRLWCGGLRAGAFTCVHGRPARRSVSELRHGSDRRLPLRHGLSFHVHGVAIVHGRRHRNCCWNVRPALAATGRNPGNPSRPRVSRAPTAPRSADRCCVPAAWWGGLVRAAPRLRRELWPVSFGL